MLSTSFHGITYNASKSMHRLLCEGTVLLHMSALLTFLIHGKSTKTSRFPPVLVNPKKLIKLSAAYKTQKTNPTAQANKTLYKAGEANEIGLTRRGYCLQALV